MERPWAINRFPFLDDEFVEFAFKSPMAGVYSRTLTPTVENRFKSQYFYAYVIKKYRPELLKMRTDHGYSPGDVLSPMPLLKIGHYPILSLAEDCQGPFRVCRNNATTDQAPYPEAGLPAVARECRETT